MKLRKDRSLVRRKNEGDKRSRQDNKRNFLLTTPRLLRSYGWSCYAKLGSQSFLLYRG